MSGWVAMVVYVGALFALYAIAWRRDASVRMTSPVGLALAALAGGVIAFCAMRGFSVSFGLALALACLVVCSVSDLASGLVFDAVTGAAACGILLSALIGAHATVSLLGACICVAPMLALYALTRGRGIGLGDVKLGGIIGAGIGGVEAIAAIGTAFVAGAVCCIPLVLARRVRRSDRVPFAPFMALGTIVLIAVRVVYAHG
jgi:leader peptidase (prepilin peptidase) / N-methyltransferase